MFEVTRKPLKAKAFVFTGKNAATEIIPELKKFFGDKPWVRFRNGGSYVKIYMEGELDFHMRKHDRLIIGDIWYEIINATEYDKFYTLKK